MSKSIRKWTKWIVIVCLIPIGLILLLSILLYIPPVQNFAVRQATKYAGEATGMQIHVDRIRLSFPLDLTVKGVEVLTAPQDTLLTLQQISVRVNPLPLIRKVVSVESLQLQEARVRSGSVVEGMEINGDIHELTASADYINPGSEEATLNALDLSGAAITLRIDSTSQKEDSVSAPVNWKLKLGKINLDHVAFGLQMPEDSLRLSAYIGEAGLQNGLVDLGISRYTVDRFHINHSDVNYDADENEPVAGLDPSHIAVTELTGDIRSIVYQDKQMEADIRALSLEERSGLVVSSLVGVAKSDSVQINVPGLTLKTPYSEIELTATAPWSVLEDPSTGTLEAQLNALLGKEDIMVFVPTLPHDFKRAYPDKQLKVAANVKGNLETLDIPQLQAELPGALRIDASGQAGALTDSLRRSAAIRLQAQVQNVNFVMSYLPADQRDRFRIPPGTRLTGTAQLQNQQYDADLRLTEDKANVLVNASYHMARESYKADLKIDSLQPIHFMPKDSILWLSGAVTAEGQGTDIYSSRTWANVAAQIDSVQYANTTLSGVTLTASLKENQAHAELNSDYPLAKVNMTLDGTLQKDNVDGIIIMDADHIDLYGMHLMDTTFTTSFQLFAEAKSDLKETNKVDITIGNWELMYANQGYRPKVLTLLARTSPDTTRVSLHSGDLGVTLTGNAGLTGMIDQFSGIADDLNRQLTVDSTVNVAALRPYLPDMDLRIRAGRDNPIYTVMRRSYINFTSIALDAHTSPERGINLDAGVYALARDTFLIDTVQATIRSDSAGLLYGVDVIKKRYRLQPPFTAHMKGKLRDRYADAELLYTNHRNETGLLLGVSAAKEDKGYTFKLYPEEPVLAFKKFRLNTDNYVHFTDMKDFAANVHLTGNENASLWLHTLDSISEFPELHVEINQFNLDSITTGFAQLPDMRGMLSADIQYAPTDETFMVVADANIDNLYYEKGRVGEIMLNAVYLPLDNSQHQVDVHLYRDRSEVTAATALYRAGQTDNNISGNLDIMTLPLNMVSPFIPDQMATLQGALNATMSIEGSISQPNLNGFLQLDTSSVYLGMADTRLRLDDKQITVKNSLISFNRYNLYSVGDNPFVIDGNIDVSNLSRMMADLKLDARNMQVLDARRTAESLVYGKLFMDFSSTLKGPLNNLVVRGDATLLGGTDATYVLTDSKLTVQDRMEGLVTFTSFADTLTLQRRPQQQLPLGGVDMFIQLHIEPAVQFRVDLNPDQSNYVEVAGGGDLTFQYNPQGDMVLNGRYTFSEGVVKYSLPVVPLKEFNIRQGSYVQWDGEVLNPLISVIATERMRATVPADGGNQRRSNFDVGISVQERLENMELQFTIESVDNAQIRGDLESKSDEERSRYAIYMMVTGSYMGSDPGNVNLGGALGSFLVGQVNSIAGDALKGVDIDLGLDSYEADGQQQNDLTFSFAKRFYNDRIRVSVGGKVSTGSNDQQTESFLDNFAAEYLLDAAGTKTIKFFHDRNFESVLEGEIVETGVGMVFRKKVLRLKELFDFRKKKVDPVLEEDDDDKRGEEATETEEETDESEATDPVENAGRENE